MRNVTFSTQTNPIDDTTVEMALIDNGDGSFTSMTKETYDAQQAAQAQPQA
jgi:hypothetical protein